MASPPGTSGNDTLEGIENEVNSIWGLNGNDTILGKSLADILSGGRGNDVLAGLDGADTLTGGGGNDILRGGAGDDILDFFDGSSADSNLGEGGTGDDFFYAGAGKDSLIGGAGQDCVSYEWLNQVMTVNLQTGLGSDGAAGDTYRSIEDIIGSQASDNLTGNGAFNEIFGGAGNDIISGGAGGDYLDGGTSFDTLSYRGSDVRVIIDLAAATARGGDAQGDQIINFEDVEGSAEADRIYGDAGPNTLKGMSGDDLLAGRAGADYLYGSSGNDTLDGDADSDWLYGQGNNDRIIGDLGNDVLSGGSGADAFVYLSTADSTLAIRDMILDFSRSQGDKIDLSAIDANSLKAKNQAFTFIGSANFHKVAGELRFVREGGNTFLNSDVNGDGIADWSVELKGSITPVAADFVL